LSRTIAFMVSLLRREDPPVLFPTWVVFETFLA
jgi:hypothetical protein